MRSVFHLPQQFAAPPAKAQQRHKILRMEATAESELVPHSEEEMRLRVEIESLRTALRGTQRQLQQYEILLRNVQIREHELRAQLLPGI